MEGIHHSKSYVDRLYIKKRNGRRGVVELETVYNVTIVGLSEYIKRGKYRLAGLVLGCDIGETKYSIQKEANLIIQKYMTQETAARNIKNQYKSSTENQEIEELKRK